MKKVFLTISCFVFACIVANAQLFIGGSIGFNSDSEKNKVGDVETKDTESSFSFVPEVGYSINDRFDVGLDLSFINEKEKNKVGNTTTEESSFTWGIAPFARYSFVEFGNFKVMAKASIGLGGVTSKEPNGTGTTETKASVFGFQVMPILGYNLSDNLLLLANLNFMSLDFFSTKVKDTDLRYTSFGFNVDANDITTIGDDAVLSIGFAYSF